ncbi:histidine kinase [Nocardia sp. NPDC004860]|uniref:sensor histidine kinase n=1 Tax=Nocardia sp. NPDC004860 TaxID=3154557 RepID=UPI0033B99D2B
MSRPRALTWVTCFTYASVLCAAWFAALSATIPATPLRLTTLTLALLALTALDLRSGRSTQVAGRIAATSRHPADDPESPTLHRRRWPPDSNPGSTPRPPDEPHRRDDGAAAESACAAVASGAPGVAAAPEPWRAGWIMAVAAVGGHAVLFAVAAAADVSGNAKVLFVLLPFEAFVTLGRRAAIGVAATILGVVATAVALHAHDRTGTARPAEFVMFSTGVVFAVALGALTVRAENGQRRAERLLAELSESHARLREYADQAASLAAAAERARVARDIHDTAGHHLAVVAIQLEKAAAYRSRDAAAADQALADARDSARAALDQVRTAVGTLRADTGGFTLAAALTTLANRLDGSGFPVRIDIAGADEPGESAAFALYLAAQEGLTNAFRHSGAPTATVRVEHRTAHSLLEISDGGRGFDPGAVAGHGLTGMRERLALLGGELRVDTGPAGTRLRARLPRGAR